MTTYRVYYRSKGCFYFMAPFVEVMASSETVAREVFYLTHDKKYHTITTVEPYGLYNNNGRYSKYFKTK